MGVHGNVVYCFEFDVTKVYLLLIYYTTFHALHCLFESNSGHNSLNLP